MYFQMRGEEISQGVLRRTKEEEVGGYKREVG